LWLGLSPEKSGVFSAGNGPAMRAAILGVSHGGESEKLKALVRSATVITHTDPKAYYGALAVALAAHLAATQDRVEGQAYCAQLEWLLQDQNADEFLGLIRAAVQSAEQGRRTTEFVQSLGLQKGVSGYVYHTVPAVLHAWLINPRNFPEALLDIISCGGDTDTTGAILGGIVGAAVGKQGIPEEWLKDLVEWPRTVDWMESLSHQLANTASSPSGAIDLPAFKVALRNAIFMLVVLLHGFRRLFPPY
jgi:ADP-ribosylglycohydrolase